MPCIPITVEPVSRPNVIRVVCRPSSTGTSTPSWAASLACQLKPARTYAKFCEPPWTRFARTKKTTTKRKSEGITSCWYKIAGLML